MDIKPWHIAVLLIVLALVGLVAWLVRAFNQGRRG
jgi:DNA-binding transcriptional regulator of glucitol operon